MNEKRGTNLLTRNFLCGLITAEGCFSIVYHKSDKRFVPLFEIRMHVRDKELVEAIRDSLGFTQKIRIHEYTNNNSHLVGFIIRKRSILINTIIPYFDDCLYGYKKSQFDEWKNFINVMSEVGTKKKINKILLQQTKDEKLFEKYGL